MAITFQSKSQIERLKQLAFGGEAELYEYGTDRVLKIYKSHVDLAQKERKVNYFISIRGKLPKNIIGPEEIVTVNGKFVGYAMRKLNDCENLHMLIKPRHLASIGFSNKDVLQIITNLGEDLGKLHSIGVIVGDVSDYNFQTVGKDNYFIDVDSWGIIGHFDPDVFTERFTCPDSYDPNGNVKFSLKSENYNFAVLAFNIMTGIHPFEGTYLPEKSLSTVARMKRNLSILGKYKKDIKIPKIIGSWKWMSPKLEDDFVRIFEQGERMDITPDLQELLDNMKYCPNHKLHYFGKYSECPICNEKAKIKTAPAMATGAQAVQKMQIVTVFSGIGCAYLLSGIHYLNTAGKAVHISTGREFAIPRGKRVYFSNDGEFVYVFSDDTIEVYDENNRLTSTIKRMHKTDFVVRDKNIYYVDLGSNLVHLTISENGNMPRYLGSVYNPFIHVSDDGKVFVASMYPKKAIITTPDYTFEVDSGKVREYAIKYDRATKKWLFVYQLSNGKYRTMVFAKNQIEYDDDVLMYNAQTLSNIDFFNNTIFDPADGKIVGTNLVKNTAREFDCSVVDEGSKIKFVGPGMRIYNKDRIYTFG